MPDFLIIKSKKSNLVGLAVEASRLGNFNDDIGHVDKITSLLNENYFIRG